MPFPKLSIFLKNLCKTPKIRVQYLSHFIEDRVLKDTSEKPALYHGDCIKSNFKPRKKWHFLGGYEQFFGIIALEDAYRASTCFKIAYQETLIKSTILGSKIYFSVFVIANDRLFTLRMKQSPLYLSDLERHIRCYHYQ